MTTKIQRLRSREKRKLFNHYPLNIISQPKYQVVINKQKTQRLFTKHKAEKVAQATDSKITKLN